MSTNEDYEKIRKKYPARLTRSRAIKLYCKSQCCCDDLESWKQCSITNCFLWRWRTGLEDTSTKTNSVKKEVVLSLKIDKNDVLEEARG
jgi:hypothetical protein